MVIMTNWMSCSLCTSFPAASTSSSMASNITSNKVTFSPFLVYRNTKHAGGKIKRIQQLNSNRNTIRFPKFLAKYVCLEYIQQTMHTSAFCLQTKTKFNYPYTQCFVTISITVSQTYYWSDSQSEMSQEYWLDSQPLHVYRCVNFKNYLHIINLFSWTSSSFA